jgi:tetratricopeptide (TPR) repeat protein
MWENIPNERDRLLVAINFINNDKTRSRNIVKDLINAKVPWVVSMATIILATNYEHEGNYKLAMQIYNEGEKRLLKGENVEYAIENFDEKECIELADIYESKGIALFAKKDYNGLIQAFEKSAILSFSKPIFQASKYEDLASAYAKIRNKEKVLDSLSKAQKCLPKLSYDDDPKIFFKTYYIQKEITKQLDNMKKGKWPSLEWYH